MGTAVRTLCEWFDVDGGRISVTKILLVLFNISAVTLVQDAPESVHIMQSLVFVNVSKGLALVPHSKGVGSTWSLTAWLRLCSSDQCCLGKLNQFSYLSNIYICAYSTLCTSYVVSLFFCQTPSIVLRLGNGFDSDLINI